MSELRWEDASSYTKSGDRTPSIWKLRVGGLVITVHRHIHFPPDAWLLSCAPWYEKSLLGVVDIDSAKERALKLVRERALTLNRALSGMPDKGEP